MLRWFWHVFFIIPWNILGNSSIIYLKGIIWTYCYKYKYLGLVLDEQLSFERHVEHIKKMIRPFVPLMWRKGRYIPVDKRKNLYYAYVQSHIMYMLPIYSQGNETPLKDLQILQNKCLKAMYRLHSSTPTTYLYSSSLLPIQELARVERTALIHRMVHSLMRHGFDLQRNTEIHNRSLRNLNAVYVPRQLPLLQQCINEFNSLSVENREIRCRKSFKFKVKLYFMTISDKFYPVTPYRYINWKL